VVTECGRDGTRLENKGTQAHVVLVDFSSNFKKFKFCIICDCRLNDDNRSETRNVCKFCKRGLES